MQLAKNIKFIIPSVYITKEGYLLEDGALNIDKNLKDYVTKYLNYKKTRDRILLDMNNTGETHEYLGGYIILKNLQIKKINFKKKNFDIYGTFDLYLKKEMKTFGKRNNLFFFDSKKKTELNLQKIYPKGKLDKEKAKELLENNDYFINLLESEISDGISYYNRAGSGTLKNDLYMNMRNLKFL